LAIDRMPAPVCFSSLVISSSNLPLQDNGEERGRDAKRQPLRVTTASHSNVRRVCTHRWTRRPFRCQWDLRPGT
jgi:hypothetical protein